ncbi:MAG TPA: ABC transporter permease [Thermoanaerobaculia bacterium]|jgi:predicted permease|nr:ABC transporter permease [Thermoanaerobaculia bacterium]
MGRLGQDLRHGIRLLARNPGFAVAALLVLALGIGANAAIFSVVNGVLLEPLPYPEPSRLVRVWHTPPPEGFPGLKTFAVSPANYLDWEAQNQVFEKMAIIGFTSLNLTGDRAPESVRAARVSGDFFAVLGSKPLLGRTLGPGDAENGGRVIVLGHAFWQSHFGGDPGVVGRDIRLDGEPYRVAGVMGPRERTPDFASAWVPLVWSAKERAVRSNHNRIVIARMKPGVSLAQAQSAMNVVSERLAQQYPEDDKGWGAVVKPLRDDLVGDVKPLLLVLLGAVGFVLLIACANVANLMLARTLARRKEIAVRGALGASRGRLLAQLLTESLVLSLAGGALGLVLASLGVDAIVALLAGQLPGSAEVHLSVPVLLFTLSLSILTGVLSGIAPAWGATRPDIARSLRLGSSRGGSEAGGRTRGLLVVSEVALSLVLLIGAGLLIRSLWLLQRVDPGFDPKNLSRMAIDLPESKYGDPQRRAAFFHALLDKARAVPGVEAAALVSDLPLTGTSNWPVAFEGRPTPPVSQQPNVVTAIVAGDYFRTMRIPILSGRAFSTSDGPDAPGAVVISQSMAQRFWPGEDPIGKRFTTYFASDKPRQVVGIVGDVKLHGLDVREPVPAMYLPLEQVPTSEMELAIRSRVPNVLTAAIAAVRALDPDQPILESGTVEQLLRDSLSRQRFAMLLLGGFAALAILLAAVGIYSVLAYGVRRRRREIGIRMALGAQTGAVLRMIVLQGMRTALVGVAIGLTAALALGRVLASLLYGVRASDPATFAAVAALLCAVALAASLLPAMRAARIDPIRTLRDE